jgi:hypothetical protein
MVVIDGLHHLLHKIFPQATRSFGGLNIVPGGLPARLGPIRAPGICLL